MGWKFAAEDFLNGAWWNRTKHIRLSRWFLRKDNKLFRKKSNIWDERCEGKCTKKFCVFRHNFISRISCAFFSSQSLSLAFLRAVIWMCTFSALKAGKCGEMLIFFAVVTSTANRDDRDHGHGRSLRSRSVAVEIWTTILPLEKSKSPPCIKSKFVPLVQISRILKQTKKLFF